MEDPSARDSSSSLESDDADEPSVPRHGDPEPDQAWKALGLVNDWIKHADAKVGASLAASGAVAILLYNLLKEQNDPGWLLTVFATVCAAAIAAAGSCAGLALMPRLTLVSKIGHLKKRRSARNSQSASSANDPDSSTAVSEHDATNEPLIDDPVNLLFFSNIAKQYDGDGPSYVEVFRSLTSDPERLTRQIAHQVHANATVAHRKFAWADRAIKFLVLALLFLGLVAITVARQDPPTVGNQGPDYRHHKASLVCGESPSMLWCGPARREPNSGHVRSHPGQ